MRISILTLGVFFQLLLTLSEARAQNWGSGQYGGAQACGYNPSQAQAAAPTEDDAITELRSEQTDLKTEKRDLAKRLRELEAKKAKFEEVISDSLTADWAQAVTAHLEEGGPCGCAPAATTPSRSEPISDKLILPSSPPRPQDRPSRGSPALSFLLEQFSPRAQALACAPVDALHASAAWKQVCVEGGSIAKEVCQLGASASNAAKNRARCGEAVGGYRKAIREIDQTGQKISRAEDRIAAITTEIRDRKRETKDAEKLEASGEKRGRRGGGSDSGPSVSTFLPLIAGVAAGVGAEYLGYKNNQANNTSLNKLGYASQPYQAGQYGYPFFQAGLYGTISSAQTGAFGCSGSIGGGGFLNGAQGMMNGLSPQGQMNPYLQQSAFGYPNTGLATGNTLAGGMYMPGQQMNFMAQSGLASQGGFGSSYPPVGTYSAPGLGVAAASLGGSSVYGTQLSYNPSLDLSFNLSRSAYGAGTLYSSGVSSQLGLYSQYAGLLGRLSLLNTGR